MNNNYKDYAVIYYLYETILISTLPKDVANKLTFSLLTLKKKNLFKVCGGTIIKRYGTVNNASNSVKIEGVKHFSNTYRKKYLIKTKQKKGLKYFFKGRNVKQTKIIKYKKILENFMKNSVKRNESHII